jgi:hypothetical protein
MKYLPITFFLLFLVTQNIQARMPAKSSPKKKISVSPKDEITNLLTDEKKYQRNKNGCALAAVGCFGTAVVAVAFGKDIKYATLPIVGMLSTASFSLWNWWSENRSYRHAHTLADKHGYAITTHDDSQKLEQMNQETQTED